MQDGQWTGTNSPGQCLAPLSRARNPTDAGSSFSPNMPKPAAHSSAVLAPARDPIRAIVLESTAKGPAAPRSSGAATKTEACQARLAETRRVQVVRLRARVVGCRLFRLEPTRGALRFEPTTRSLSGYSELTVSRDTAFAARTQNLFLSLSTPHSTLSRLFPFLRHPLDIRLATETLARVWSQTLLHRPLVESELALLNRLQSLDARLIYIAYGARPLMQCEWCRPPGAGSSSSLGGTIIGLDYLLAAAPTILIAYLTTLVACGLLLSGNGRQRWRIWIVIATVSGVGAEAYMRLTWDGGRGQAAAGASISMVRARSYDLSLSLLHVFSLIARPHQIHSQLHVLRSLFFASLLTISYLAPASFASVPAQLQPGTSTIVAPALAALTNQSEDALQRLRALSIARMAVLHEDRSRKEVSS